MYHINYYTMILSKMIQ